MSSDPPGGTGHSITIGSRDECDLVFDKPTVSSRHARLVWDKDAGAWFLEDIGSTNGTFLRGVRLQPGQRAEVALGDEVYLGMVVGENNKDNDLVLNVVRGKKLTNVRPPNKDVDEKIRGARLMGLEQLLEYVDDDELVEVTPQSLRLRKRLLNEKERKRAAERVAGE